MLICCSEIFCNIWQKYCGNISIAMKDWKYFCFCNILCYVEKEPFFKIIETYKRGLLSYRSYRFVSSKNSFVPSGGQIYSTVKIVRWRLDIFQDNRYVQTGSAFMSFLRVLYHQEIRLYLKGVRYIVRSKSLVVT